MSWAPCIGLVFMLCQQPDPPPPPPPVVVCLRTKAWSKPYQKQLRDQIAALPPGSPLIVAMGELLNLRDQNRACKEMQNVGAPK